MKIGVLIVKTGKRILFFCFYILSNIPGDFCIPFTLDSEFTLTPYVLDKIVWRHSVTIFCIAELTWEISTENPFFTF